MARREAEIAEQQRLLEEAQAEEVKLRQKRAEEEEKKLAQEEAYSSLQEEAESKTRKLKQLWAKFRAAQSEIDDLQMEQQQEKQDLLHTVRELTRQVQLQNMVIEAFVPPEEVQKLEKRARVGRRRRGVAAAAAVRGTRQGGGGAPHLAPVAHPPRRPSSRARWRRPHQQRAALPLDQHPLLRPRHARAHDGRLRRRRQSQRARCPHRRAARRRAARGGGRGEPAEHGRIRLVPGQEGGAPNLGGNRLAPGANAAAAARQLTGRDRTADAARRKAAAKKAAMKKKKEEEDLDALLGGGSRDAPAEEAFPQSRGLLGKGRR